MKCFAIVAVTVLAMPAIASAQPTRYTVDARLAPGERVTLVVGKVPRGEFRFSLRASGDGEKRFGLTQQRGVAPRFAVLNYPSAFAAGACQGAAGSVVCRGISTPAPVAGSTYAFRLKNKGDRPLSVTLTVVWRPVASAG
jgi:hypothetical protein